MSNNNLHTARIVKNDEFYTQYQDIEKELSYYIEYNPEIFRDKTILLPCDTPELSNFTKYFIDNFKRLKLKKLISTCYFNENAKLSSLDLNSIFNIQPKGKYFIMNKDRIKKGNLNSNGDFRSNEIKKFRNESDFIITNPPFSLFGKFIDWIFEANKKFIIIGNTNAITYKNVFRLIKENKIWLGINSNMKFVYNNKIIDIPSYWFTNVFHGRVPKFLKLNSMEYNIKNNNIKYQKYDNYNAIEVSRITFIPEDYKGVMGVPITFLEKYNPEQFKIVGLSKYIDNKKLFYIKNYDNYIEFNKNGKKTGNHGNNFNRKTPVLKGNDRKNNYYVNRKGGVIQVLYHRIFIKHRIKE